MTKLYSLLIALFLTATSFTTVLAQVEIADEQGNMLWYKLDAKLESAMLLRNQSGKAYEYKVVDIPETVTHDGKEYKVKNIEQNAFKGSKVLTSITIPRHVTAIGGHAFAGCENLATVNFLATNCRKAATEYSGEMYAAFEDCSSITTVNFGDEVTYIPEYIFWGCTGIKSITLPENVEVVGGASFLDCTSLTTLTFNAYKCTSMSSVIKGKTYPAFINTNVSVLKFGPLVTSIPAFAFNGFDGITSIEIPEQVTSIGGAAFRGCESLTNVTFNATNCAVSHTAKGESLLPPFGNESITTVTFGDKVEKIPDFLFWGCKGIQNLTLTNNIMVIGESAFFGCSSLTSITIPEGIDVIKGRAFGGCSNLSQVNFNALKCETMHSIEKGKMIPAFEKSSITSVRVGDDVTRIPDHAFADCPSLVEVNLPYTVKYIGYKSFNNCTSLKSIYIPEECEQIGGLAFGGCEKLTSISFEATKCKGASSLENKKHVSAFQSLPALKEVKFSANVTNIPDYLFAGCTALNEITIPKNVKAIGGNTFIGCSNLNTIHFDAKDCAVSFTNNENRMRSAFTSESITKVTFGSNVKSIPDYAFSGCVRLATINLPDSLESIGQFAFEDCAGLQKLTIPELVKNVKGGAFIGCNNLREVQFNAIECHSMSSMQDDKVVPAFASRSIYMITIGSDVEIVPDYAFYQCAATTEVKFGAALTKIGKYAFAENSSLTTITLPAQLESIGGAAFKDCEQLATVNYNPIKCKGAFELEGDEILYPFAGKNKIAFINIGGKVESIPEGMFYNSQKVKILEIPKNIQQLGAYSFGNCPLLKTVNFNALECNNVSGVVGDTVRSAFEGSKLLASVIFHPKMKSIPDYMLQNCVGIKRVMIPEGATRVGKYAFKNCKLLKRVKLPLSVTTIGERAFWGSGIAAMAIHDNISDIGEAALANCPFLGNVTVKKKNKDYALFKGLLYSKDLSTLIVAPNLRTGTKLILDKKTTAIEPYAFHTCKILIDLTLPENLTSIGKDAFVGNLKLTKITINSPSAPSTDGEIFDENIKNVNLVVKKGSKSEYTNSKTWNAAKTITEK